MSIIALYCFYLEVHLYWTTFSLTLDFPLILFALYTRRRACCSRLWGICSEALLPSLAYTTPRNNQSGPPAPIGRPSHSHTDIRFLF